MKKKNIIHRLEKELEFAKKRQKPNATKDSGHMRGLKKAIEIIKMY